MIDTDRLAFADCFTTLALAQGGPNDPDTAIAYFEALRDIPFAAVEQAAKNLARTAGDFFPRAAKWHEAALAAHRSHFESAYIAPGGRDEPWKYECESCKDTGWIERWIEKGEPCYSQYHRRDLPAMYRHQAARACPCRPTNHTYQRLHVNAPKEPDETPPERPRRTGKSRGWQKL